jgi:hypothetical protein
MPVPTSLRYSFLITLAVCGSCLTGCDGGDADGVRTYLAPTDPPPPAAPAPKELPIAWTLPAGWTRLPDAGPSAFGSVAKIQVSPDDPTLTLNVNLVQSADVVSNVNRWEGQLGLEPTPAAAISSKAKEIQVEAHAAHRVDLTAADGATRMLAVILPEGGGAWTFLLKGPAEKVAAQEAAFDKFIASVNFPSHNHGDAPAAQTQPTDTKSYALTGYGTPGGWEKDTTERQMRVATLYVGQGNERAELIVTKFAFDRFGTMLNNINRWRGEVGLPATDNELKENFRELKAAGLTGIIFDFQGTEKRSYVAMFRKGGDMWFVKLIGPAGTVAAQRENYDAFLQSLQFGDAG